MPKPPPLAKPLQTDIASRFFTRSLTEQARQVMAPFLGISSANTTAHFLYMHTINPGRLNDYRIAGSTTDTQLAAFASRRRMEIYEGSGLAGRGDGLYAVVLDMNNTSPQISSQSPMAATDFFNPKASNRIVFTASNPFVRPHMAGLTAYWSKSDQDAVPIEPVITHSDTGQYKVYNQQLVKQWTHNIMAHTRGNLEDIKFLCQLFEVQSTGDLRADVSALAQVMVHKDLAKFRASETISYIDRQEALIKELAKVPGVEIEPSLSQPLYRQTSYTADMRAALSELKAAHRAAVAPSLDTEEPKGPNTGPSY